MTGYIIYLLKMTADWLEFMNFSLVASSGVSRISFWGGGVWLTGGSPGNIGEVHVALVKRQKGWRTSYDVDEATEGLENEQSLLPNPFRRFTYVTAHSITLTSLHLNHSSFLNPSIASPMSQALPLRHLASHPWSHTCSTGVIPFKL